MNYEKKYKDALERAKYALTTDMDNSGHWAVNYIFPELKESEDERIRKMLRAYIHDFGVPKEYFEDVETSDVLAWLEKQGEKRPTENVEKKFCEGDKVVSNQDGKVYIVGTEYYVTGDNICLHDIDGNPGDHKWTNRDDLDKNYRLWTSEDAKKLDADEVIE